MVVTRQAVHQRADITVEHHIVVNGVKLIRSTTGRYFAESGSQPDRLWFLTGFSCQCPAFVYRQACRHHRALMTALGWISDTPEPAPPASTVLPDSGKTSPTCSTCGECGGLGEVQDLEVRQHGRFVMQWASCPACRGTGQRTAAAA